MYMFIKHYGRPQATCELRPCPFCRSEDLKLSVVSYAPLMYSIICQNCWSKSGIKYDEIDAINLWNGKETSDD